MAAPSMPSAQLVVKERMATALWPEESCRTVLLGAQSSNFQKAVGPNPPGPPPPPLVVEDTTEEPLPGPGGMPLPTLTPLTVTAMALVLTALVPGAPPTPESCAIA